MKTGNFSLHTMTRYDIISLNSKHSIGGETYEARKDFNKTLKESMKKGGCGECQTSCQSACKTSCTVGNQSCENPNR